MRLATFPVYAGEVNGDIWVTDAWELVMFIVGHDERHAILGATPVGATNLAEDEDGALVLPHRRQPTGIRPGVADTRKDDERG